jgi:hypothetical protein
MPRRLLPLLFLLLGAAALRAAEWPVGTRVIVEKAGTGHRAVVLRSEPARSFVAYEGADETHDEWVESERIRPTRPAPAPAAAGSEPAPAAPAAEPAPAEPEPLPHELELPRAAKGASVAEIWLGPLPRQSPSDPPRFNTGALAVPQFRFGAATGIPTSVAPLRAVALPGRDGVRRFAALEDGVALYARDEARGFVRTDELDLASLEGFAPEHLLAHDVDQDGATDLVVAGGPVVQVFFADGGGGFQPAVRAHRAREPVRGVAAGRLFPGPLGHGLAVVEGPNRFVLLRVARAGLTAPDAPTEVKFDRITRLVAGDFDGDGFSDLALATESNGRSTGAWIYFNQRGDQRVFPWPVGGRDDFARDLAVGDLDRDGRDDLVLTDSDADRGERVRVVFGAAGRAGWEDPWDLFAKEYGVGLGTASVTVADFNRDGRPDVGVAGRNGLRVHLGADYRRLSRNPVWPRLAGGGDFPEQRAFLAADFDGDGATDLLAYTPAFATGYNLLFGATPATVEGVHVPAPLRRPRQATLTTSEVEARAPAPEASAGPQVRFLASRAEPYGQWRYRIVVEVAAIGDRVIEAVTAVCRYGETGRPVQEIEATPRRISEQQWALEVTLPRGRSYEFTVAARDNQGRTSDPLRVRVSP